MNNNKVSLLKRNLKFYEDKITGQMGFWIYGHVDKGLFLELVKEEIEKDGLDIIYKDNILDQIKQDNWIKDDKTNYFIHGEGPDSFPVTRVSINIIPADPAIDSLKNVNKEKLLEAITDFTTFITQIIDSFKKELENEKSRDRD